MENKNKQTEVKKEIVEDKKRIGNYTIILNTEFNKKDSDYINLKINISDDLQTLLRQAVIDETEEVHLSNVSAKDRLIRYKVKGWIYRELAYSSYKELLFLKKLVDKKSVKIAFASATGISEAIDGLKTNFKIFVQTIRDLSDLNITINYGVK